MIEHVSKMFQEHPEFAKHPWLVIGKGPSFNTGKMKQFIRRKVPCIATINQAANFMKAIDEKADVAFFHDIEPMLDVEPNRAYAYCLPWVPHFRARPDSRTLEQWRNHTVNLRGPICYSYDLSTTGSELTHFKDQPRIESNCFTYESVLQILGHAGVKEIITCGIDGGSARHPYFVGTHQEEKPSSGYDYQFEAEKKWKAKFGLKIQRL